MEAEAARAEVVAARRAIEEVQAEAEAHRRAAKEGRGQTARPVFDTT